MIGLALGLLLGAGAALILVSLRPPGAGGARAGQLGQLAARAGSSGVHPGTILAAMLSTALLAGSLAMAAWGIPAIGLLAGAVGAYLPVGLLRRRARARQEALRESWPEVVDALVSAVRAGVPLPAALADLADRGPLPLAPALRGFASAQGYGASFQVSVGRLRAELRDPVADQVCEALLIAHEFGGVQLADMLRTLSANLRHDSRARAEILGRQSWTVTAARVAVAAPFATALLMATQPQAAAAYTSAVGTVVLLGCGVMCAVAYWLMLRLAVLPRERRVLR